MNRKSVASLPVRAELLRRVTLAACGGGGAPTMVNQQSTPPSSTANAYTGPAAANADVQAFKINLWENIRPAAAVGGADVFPQVDLECLHVRIRCRGPGVGVRSAAGGRRLLIHHGRRAPAAACCQGDEPQERCTHRQAGNGFAVHCGAPLLARTGGSGQLEHLLEFVAAGLEARLDG